jgi:PKD repeat protein
VRAPGSQPSAGTAYTATLWWGDGTTSDATVTPLTGGSGPLQLAVTGDHVYPEEGTYAVTAVVSDPSGNQTSASATAYVVDAPLAGYGLGLLAVAGVPTGSVAVAGFLDNNPDAASQDFTATDYTATVSWGDGSLNSSGTVLANGDGSFSVYAGHTYPGPGIFAVTTTVTDEGGQTTQATSVATVVVPWGILGGGTGQVADDPTGAFLVPVGEAAVDLNQGALRLRHALDFDQSPGTAVGGNPALVYNSSTVQVRPVIQLEVQGDPNGLAPTQAQVQLTWNGTPQAPVLFNTAGQLPGAVYTLAVQLANPVAASGAYPWSATVTFLFPDNSTRQATAAGTASVVARDASPYGAGWGIDGLSQLVVGPTGALLVTGAGDSRFFTGTGGNYTVSVRPIAWCMASGSQRKRRPEARRKNTVHVRRTPPAGGAVSASS